MYSLEDTSTAINSHRRYGRVTCVGTCVWLFLGSSGGFDEQPSV